MTRARGADAVTLVVPVRDEADTLAAFLASLDAQTVPPRAIVLVDAGSTDTTRMMLERYAARMPHVRFVEAEGAFPGRARNIGVRAADSEWIALTDAGTIIDPQWLANLVASLDADPSIDVVFGTYEPLISTAFQRCLALCFLAPGRLVGGRRYRGPSTASMLIRKPAWEEIGGFPEDLRACEDLLFFRKLTAAGYRTACAPSAVVHWHLPGTLHDVFRRFRTYSHHTLKAGLGMEWHAAVATMYAVATVCLLAAAAVHWSLILVPIIGLALRAIQSVRRRPDVLDTSMALRLYLAVGAMLLWIDMSALVGAFDYALDRLEHREPSSVIC